MNVRWRRVWLCGWLVLLASCGGSGPQPVRVSGRVTLDGAPLAGAYVSFQPRRDQPNAAATGSYATTSADGSFHLKLLQPKISGALPGLHRVRITTSRPLDPAREDSPTTQERVPLRYRDGLLGFQVPPQGTTAANFALTSHDAAQR